MTPVGRSTVVTLFARTESVWRSPRTSNETVRFNACFKAREIMLTNAAIDCKEPSGPEVALDLGIEDICQAHSQNVSGGEAINLASVDLNLLVALEALLQLRNVTHAGKRVGLSQPAMSRALARLRAVFNDDLLVRTPRGLTLTIRAEQLLAKLPEALGLIREIISGRDLYAGKTRREINIVMPEHLSLVLLPVLMPRLLKMEPSLDLVVRTDLSGALQNLEDGSIDFAIGRMNHSPSGFYSRMLYSDKLACLLRRNHPALKQPWTKERFLQLRHATLSCGTEPGSQGIADVLGNQIHSNHEPLVVPGLTVARLMVAQTDLALVLPYRAARSVSSASLVVMELPEEFLQAEVALIWHERCHRDPRHRWMRNEFAAAAHHHI